LEALLKLRRQREDEKKRIVAARLREIATLEQRRTTLLAEIDQHTEAMRQALSAASANLDQLKMGRHWLVRLRRGVLDTDAQLNAQRVILLRERAELAEARKDTKVLERLKERQRIAYLAALNRREQMELDEMNSLRHAHAMMGPEGEEAWTADVWRGDVEEPAAV
jgi:flagellar export protein FliJ